MRWLKRLSSRSPQSTPPVVATIPAETPVVAPPNTHPIQTADDLLLPRGEWIHRIETLSGTTRPHFAQYYLPAIKQMAAFVQLCPASEAHHHAHLGGLLDHVLDMTQAALTLRQGYLLPPHAPPEEIPHRQDVWTYAVFTGAMLHDIAKPAVDMCITLYSEDGQRQWRWNPWRGRMREEEKAHWYRIEYRQQRQYLVHERAALTLAPHLIPAEGLHWLAQDLEAFAAWLAYASGDSAGAGVLGEILSQADQHSVSRSLGAESRPRAVHTQVIPLSEKLLTALRYLIDQQELPLNRNGAAGWLIQDDVWLVSKRVADALRAHLTLNGHSGIPNSNDRLFDALQDHGILTPNGDRAIWMADILGDKWAHTLTLLRIPANKLWLNPDKWPEAFAGTIRFKVGNEDSGTEADEVVVKTETPNHSPAAEPANAIPKPPEPPQNQYPVREPSGFAPDDPGLLFLKWVRTGLANQRLTYNCAESRVHVVADGVLLISPAIFRDYAEANPNADAWKTIQSHFLRLNLHQRHGDKGLNVLQYQIKDAESRLTGHLIQDVSYFFSFNPKHNPALVRLTPK